MKAISRLLFQMCLFVLCASSIVIATEAGDSNALSKEYLQDTSILHALGQQKDLEGLEKAANEIEMKSFAKGPEYYGDIMCKVCGAFRSWDFGNGRRMQYELAQQYAFRALGRAANLPENNKIPIDFEFRLEEHVHGRSEFKKWAKEENWPERRSRMAKFSFHAWQRLEKAIDENWDPNDPSIVPPMPLPAVGKGWAGMDPEAIEDPNLRAEYEAALDKYWEAVGRYTQQVHLRQVKEDRLPRLKARVLRLYSGPSFESKNLEATALQEDLEKHVDDEQLRARTLNEIRAELAEKPKRKPGPRARAARSGDSQQYMRSGANAPPDVEE